jgi:SAM-dependent methyltransferase
MSYNISETNPERQGLLGYNYNQLAAKYYQQISLPEKSHILDLGCGQGEATRLLYQTFSPAQCIGFDLDEALIEIAINKGGGPIYQQGNAKKLPFENDSFDLVFARLLLIHVPGCEDVIQEMVRVCKPGGTVMVQDLVIPKTADLYPENWAYEKINQAMRELFANPDMGKQLPLLFKNHGLADIRIRSDIFLLHEKGLAKKLMTQTAEGMLERMLENGILEESKKTEFIEEMKRVEASNNYTFLTNPFITVWGAKI